MVQPDDAAMAGGAAAPLVGRRVRVEGLAGRPELNGRCGEAEAYDATRGRYLVMVEGEPSQLLLRPDNLIAIGHAAAGDANVFPNGPNWSLNCAGCGAAPPEGGRHSMLCPLCPSTYFCGKHCPGKPFEKHEAWHAQNDQENDGEAQEAADRMQWQQTHRKAAEQQARQAKKSGSEYGRLLAAAMHHMAEENFEAGEESFRSAIALEPNNPTAHYNLGALCSNERRIPEAVQNFLHAAALLREGGAEWADCITFAFHHLLSPECNEVAKPEWWNDEDLKNLSKTVTACLGASEDREGGTAFRKQSRLHGHLMRMEVLGTGHLGALGSCAWKSGPRSSTDLNEAATHAGFAAQKFLARGASKYSIRAVELLGVAADLFDKAADMEPIEAKVKDAKAEAKAKAEAAEAVVRAEAKAKAEAAEAVVRAEAETKANVAAGALLAEEAAEAIAAATSAPGKAKAKGKSNKGKGKRGP